MFALSTMTSSVQVTAWNLLLYNLKVQVCSMILVLLPGVQPFPECTGGWPSAPAGYCLVLQSKSVQNQCVSYLYLCPVALYRIWPAGNGGDHPETLSGTVEDTWEWLTLSTCVSFLLLCFSPSCSWFGTGVILMSTDMDWREAKASWRKDFRWSTKEYLKHNSTTYRAKLKDLNSICK